MRRFLVLFLILFFINSFQVPEAGASACFDLNTNLRYGTRDSATRRDIFELQTFLKEKGYLVVNPTGYFGSLTMRAVKSFQTANSIPPTGFVGPLTRASIKSITCVPEVLPNPTPQNPESNPPVATPPDVQNPATTDAPPSPMPTPEPTQDEVLSAGSASSLRVRTKNPISITTSSVLVAGQVTSGARSGTQTWFELTTNPDAYKLSETKTTAKANQRSEGDFNAWFTELSPNTMYYYRACVENVALGQKMCEGTVSFKTLSN